MSPFSDPWCYTAWERGIICLSWCATVQSIYPTFIHFIVFYYTGSVVLCVLISFSVLTVRWWYYYCVSSFPLSICKLLNKSLPADILSRLLAQIKRKWQWWWQRLNNDNKKTSFWDLVQFNFILNTWQVIISETGFFHTDLRALWTSCCMWLMRKDACRIANH